MKGYIVVVGQENKAIELPTRDNATPVFSPDGKQLAYVVTKNGHRVMICDGKEGPPYQVISWGIFSANSQTLVYEAMTDKNEHFWVVGGRPQGPYDQMGAWAISPDGKRFAFAGMQKGEQTLICDGEAGCGIRPDSARRLLARFQEPRLCCPERRRPR